MNPTARHQLPSSSHGDQCNQSTFRHNVPPMAAARVACVALWHLDVNHATDAMVLLGQFGRYQ